MKKRKSFYDNKNRNSKWTEPEVGRPIDFAEKYEENEGYVTGYDSRRALLNNEKQKRLLKQKRRRRFGAFLLAVAVFITGYVIMDVHIIRHTAPLTRFEEQQKNGKSSSALISESFKAASTEGAGLDAGVMLSSLIGDLKKEGFTGLSFEAKRPDGTLAYRAALEAAAVSDVVFSPSPNLKASVNELRAQDIVPIAVVSCYLDNRMPALSPEMALTQDGKLYTDSQGNTYLSPDSEVAYAYIRDVIGELCASGLNVFVLKNCDLPEDVKSGHQDGFKALSKKLSADLKYDVRLLEEVDVSLASGNEKGLEKEIKDFPDTGESGVYVISSSLDYADYSASLDRAKIENYIIQ
jgi:hypothetical protein